MSQEAIRIQLDRLRAELAGPDPMPVERLLADRVALGWLDVNQAQTCAARARPSERVYRDSCQRELSRAQARYLSALKHLVTLRKLQRPAPSPLEMVGRPVNESPPPQTGTPRLTPVTTN
jgi:hypothetical protein